MPDESATPDEAVFRSYSEPSTDELPEAIFRSYSTPQEGTPSELRSEPAINGGTDAE
jgi:hypothetical protein